MAEIDELLARIAPTWQPSMPPAMPPAMARQPTGNLGSAFEQRLPYQPQGMQMLNKAPSFPYGAQPAPMPKTDFSRMPTDYAWGSPPPPMSPTGKDMSRIPYEETPQQAPQERKAGRLDMQQPAAQPKYSGLVPESMLPILADMVKRNPDLLKNPRAMGHIITKLMPFMKKQDQERHAQAKEEFARRRDERADERLEAAQRLEAHKLWLEQVRDKTAEAKTAWSRLKDVEDPTKEFLGDRKALVQRYTDEYEAAEAERKKLQVASPYKQRDKEAGPKADATYAKGTQGAPGAVLDEKSHSALTTQYEKGLAKAQAALKNAKSIDERNLILGNTLRYTDQAREEAGMPAMTDAERTAFVQDQPSHDISTYGEQAEDWLGQKAQEYFPTAYQFYKDMNSFEPSMWDDPLSPNRILSGLDPLAAESQYAHGLRKARGMEPSAAEMERNETSSVPERALGALRALGGAAGPVATAANPLATTGIGGLGGSVEQATGSPWAGLASMLAAGGGLGGLERQARGAPQRPGAPPPQGPTGMPPLTGAPFNPMQGMTGAPGGAAPGLAGRPGPSAPPPSGMMGAPAGAQVGGSPVGQMPPAGVPGLPPGIPQLPPPGPAGPARGPMPGSVTGAGPSVRPKAGLYGRPPVQGEQRPIEMPDPSIRMGGPGEQGRLPPPRAPEPVDPVSRAEAAAEISAGKEPAPPVEKPSRLQSDVTQFGDHAVGDSVKFNGKTYKIEELVPAKPGNVAAKAKLEGRKTPVSITALEPAGRTDRMEAALGKLASGYKPPEFTAAAKVGETAAWATPGQRVQWSAVGTGTILRGTIEGVTKSGSRVTARVRKTDGSVVPIPVGILKPVQG